MLFANVKRCGRARALANGGRTITAELFGATVLPRGIPPAMRVSDSHGLEAEDLDAVVVLLIVEFGG